MQSLLQKDTVSLLQMAASMLPQEPELPPSDIEAIRVSMEELRKCLDGSDIKPSARNALLELVRLSRNAIDYYSIYGARGFKKAFKRMLAELLELMSQEGKEVKKEPWYDVAAKLIGLVERASAAANNVQPLLEQTMTFLGSINLS